MNGEEVSGGVKRNEKERERGRGRKILPGVTNALPRGGEVSSMFMPWFTGLPIVPNGPRPRCLPRRPLYFATPSLQPSTPVEKPSSTVPFVVPSPPLSFSISTYIFRSLAGEIVTLIGNGIGACVYSRGGRGRGLN